MDQALREQVESTLSANEVVLFMKGSRMFPQCGFSAKVVEILKSLQVPFKDVNIFADPALRDGMKEFSEWPTFPQLYVRGQFIGGCDIVSDLYEKGELEQLLRPSA
ncbi:MAG: Grx4 family monothiol glutaredoxin [Polyangiaceae bacterium]|nr:Grx4 family monothiol glutaredoxin [Polyangiaceae bacterium]MCW5791381.1 Grx4 family monothiol glutaredoxin [Polyangiaceae bacterium]